MNPTERLAAYLDGLMFEAINNHNRQAHKAAMDNLHVDRHPSASALHMARDLLETLGLTTPSRLAVSTEEAEDIANDAMVSGLAACERLRARLRTQSKKRRGLRHTAKCALRGIKRREKSRAMYGDLWRFTSMVARQAMNTGLAECERLRAERDQALGRLERVEAAGVRACVSLGCQGDDEQGCRRDDVDIPREEWCTLCLLSEVLESLR